MTFRKTFFGATLVTALVAAGPANAILADLTSNDFTLTGGGTTGSTTGTIDLFGGLVTLTLTGSSTLDISETFNTAGATFCQDNSGPLACDFDGVGVAGGDNDELSLLSASETVTVTWTSTATDVDVKIAGFHVLDMFEGPTSGEKESALLAVDGTSVAGDFSAQVANTTDSYGYGAFTFTATDILTSAIFSVGLGNDDFGSPDYALAGLDIEVFQGGQPVVPIPAAVWLFGSALLGVVGVGYRRNRGQAQA